MQLLIATTNQGKQHEIEQALLDLNVTLFFPSDFPATSQLTVAETGSTFAENATLKAVAYATAAGIPALADDSGIGIAALDGFPGVASARWYPGSSTERVAALLTKMQSLTDRRAVFSTVLCLFDPETHQTKLFTGSQEGSIADTAYGSNGFEYDTVFIPSGFTHRYAELSTEEKNAHSHRGKALMAVRQYLEKLN